MSGDDLASTGGPASGGGPTSGGPSAPPGELEVDRHALIAAHVAVFTDRPRADVLLSFHLSEAEWDARVDAFTRRMVDEIRARAGSSTPIEERYPLSARYAKSYALAVRDLRDQEQHDLHADEDATLRIPPTSSRDEPFSVFSASNRAASSPSNPKK